MRGRCRIIVKRVLRSTMHPDRRPLEREDQTTLPTTRYSTVFFLAASLADHDLGGDELLAASRVRARVTALGGRQVVRPLVRPHRPPAPSEARNINQEWLCDCHCPLTPLDAIPSHARGPWFDPSAPIGHKRLEIAVSCCARSSTPALYPHSVLPKYLGFVQPDWQCGARGTGRCPRRRRLIPPRVARAHGAQDSCVARGPLPRS